MALFRQPSPVPHAPVPLPPVDLQRNPRRCPGGPPPAAAATPKPVIDRINTEIKKVLERPDNKLDDFEPWYMTPEQAQARIRADYEKHGRLVKAIGGSVN